MPRGPGQPFTVVAKNPLTFPIAPRAQDACVLPDAASGAAAPRRNNNQHQTRKKDLTAAVVGFISFLKF
jgi:hypothetical protein